MTVRSFTCAPIFRMADDADVHIREHVAREAEMLWVDVQARSEDIASWSMTRDAAILLRDKLTAALVDAPGTSSPQREPGDAA